MDQHDEAKALSDALILIVEDSMVNRVLLQHWCRGWGGSVCVATSLNEAKHWLGVGGITHALVDQQLPDGLGEVLIAPLRDQGCKRILGMSLLDGESARLALQASGYDEVLPKPLEHAVLLTALLGASLAAEPVKLDWELFDRAAALSRLDDDEALYAEIATVFISQWPQLRSRLLESSADEAEFIAANHTAAGLFGQLGFNGLMGALRDLEQNATKMDSVARHHALMPLLAQLDRGVQALQATQPHS